MCYLSGLTGNRILLNGQGLLPGVPRATGERGFPFQTPDQTARLDAWFSDTSECSARCESKGSLTLRKFALTLAPEEDL